MRPVSRRDIDAKGAHKDAQKVRVPLSQGAQGARGQGARGQGVRERTPHRGRVHIRARPPEQKSKRSSATRVCVTA